MPSLKDLQVRIKSVKNTQQITRTMKMVAAAKVRKARENCEASRPYAERLNTVLVNLAKNVDPQGAPSLLAGRQEVNTVRIIVFGSDRGLCGGFNANLIRAVKQRVESLLAEGKKVQLVTHGRKSKEILKAYFPDMFAAEYADVEISYDHARNVGTQMLKDFEAGQCDQVLMFYNEFVSMLRQEPTEQSLIPFTADSALDSESEQTAAAVEYEPSEEVVIESLLPQNLNMQILRAMLESSASEYAARMTAMDNASRNAGEMIKNLQLVFNRTRQAAITREMIEIVSGAEAAVQ